MALGTPTSAATSVSLGAVSSGAITVTAPANSRLFIAVGGPTSTSRTVSSVAGTDNTAGAVNLAVVKAVTVAGIFTELWSANLTNAVTAKSFTATFSGAIAAGALVAWYQAGAATSSPADGAGFSYTEAGPTDSTVSVGPITTTNANDTVYGVIVADNNSANSFTPSGTVINELFDFHTGNDIQMSVVYVTVAATSTYTATGAWAVGANIEAGLLVGIKEAAGGTDATVTAVVADALGSAPVATVSGGANGTVTAVTAAATGDNPAAVITATATVTAATALGLGSAPPANSILSSVVTGVAVVALGSAPVASVSGGGNGTVTAAIATGLGSAPVASLSAGQVVTAVVADATGAGVAATVSTATAVAAVPAVAVGQALRPSISPAPAGGGGGTAQVAATFAEVGA